MRSLPSAVASILACALALGACGSTTPSQRTATINAALRRLQTEVEQQSSKLNQEIRGHGGSPDVLGRISLFYAAPPKGVTPAEWEAAMSKDQALQRVVGQPSPAEVERKRRREIEAEAQSFWTVWPGVKTPTH